MDECEKIEKTIEHTFNDAYQNGFPEERLDAILHKMELGLKKQVTFSVSNSRIFLSISSFVDFLKLKIF
jgi:Zn-dependent M16 (insulinase) family peptidase